ncbi:hypothetical protein L1049_000151 [Liquidambar formosana]|uniref:Pectinesterase inhibitor domain-containing protein n=1 Tax=Liquidambar formosana TaxID=63359 RepID=A0AAP0NA25_LIQFO
MASFNLFLLTLTLFIFLNQPFLLVMADEALITNLCSKTTEPGTCSSCLKSDPSSSTADARGLAKIASHCAEFDTSIFHDKHLLDGCSSGSFLAVADFDGVASSIDSGDYGSAKGIISDEILPQVNHCLADFEKFPTLPVPPDVLAGTHIVNEDCNIVLAILSNI